MIRQMIVDVDNIEGLQPSINCRSSIYHGLQVCLNRFASKVLTVGDVTGRRDVVQMIDELVCIMSSKAKMKFEKLILIRATNLEMKFSLRVNRGEEILTCLHCSGTSVSSLTIERAEGRGVARVRVKQHSSRTRSPSSFITGGNFIRWRAPASALKMQKRTGGDPMCELIGRLVERTLVQRGLGRINDGVCNSD